MMREATSDELTKALSRAHWPQAEFSFGTRYQTKRYSHCGKEVAQIDTFLKRGKPVSTVILVNDEFLT